MALGMTLREVAIAAGIGGRTLDTWLARAHKAEHLQRTTKRIPVAERPYLELHRDILEAEEGADVQALHSIGEQIAGGLDLADAANAAGIPLSILARLQTRATQISNRRDDGDRLDAGELEYLQLFDGFAQAAARSKRKAIRSVERGMDDDWRAGAWYLERMYPEQFATAASRGRAGVGGRPVGATSAPDRPSTGDEPPPRIRLTRVQ